MRVKQLWHYVPLPAKIKLLVDRVTFSRLTLFYFVFAIVHCLIQVVFQVQAFNINMNAARFLGDIISKGNAAEPGFMVLGKDLRLCDTVPVPAKIDASSCKLVWNGASTNSTGSNAAGLAAQDVAQGPSSSSPVAVSSHSTSVATSSSSTQSETLSSSVTEPSSSAVPSSQGTQSSSASHRSTVTVTVRPTITNLSQFNSDVAVTTVRATQTITVTSKPTASAADEEDDDEDDDNEDILHVHKRATARLATASNGSQEVEIDGLRGGTVTLSQTCLRALNWPVSKVDNTKREDIVFVGFSIWVLGMSIVAILNESPPHIVASFLTHMLATAWSGYQLANTNSFHKDFTRLLTNGACGVNLLPTYWSERAKFEIPTLAMNALALVISAVLSWRLLKQFGWQTFKKIGASLTMSRAYRSILVFSIVLQLSLFFVVAALALWLDQIYNGDIGKLTTKSEVFRGIDITILILVLPWLTMGWIAVRREYRFPMIGFLTLSFLYLVGWASMFAAPTFRWTFVEWRFFSLMASASVALSLLLLILGIICRMNFGRGLTKYLGSQETLPGDDFEPANFTYEKFDEEKIEFPSYQTPIPTFAAAYGDDLVAPPPTHAPLGARVLGPRFFAQNQETQVQLPPLGAAPPYTKGHLARQESSSSQRSGSSTWSSSNEDMRGKRWIIE